MVRCALSGALAGVEAGTGRFRQAALQLLPHRLLLDGSRAGCMRLRLGCCMLRLLVSLVSPSESEYDADRRVERRIGK